MFQMTYLFLSFKKREINSDLDIDIVSLSESFETGVKLRLKSFAYDDDDLQTGLKIIVVIGVCETQCHKFQK